MRKISILLLLGVLVGVIIACGPAATTAPANTPAAANTAVPAANTPAAANTAVPAANTVAPTAAPTAVPTAKPAAQVLRLNLGSEPDTIDPQKESFVSEVDVTMKVFSNLLTFDSSGNLVPEMAAAMPTFSADGKTITFK